MKFRKNKKGFTIVELVIVIAVIGILTAVMVPTIVHLVNKANKASDDSLVTNLNKAIALRQAETQKAPATMHETVEGLREYGYNVDALVAKSDEALLYDLEGNKFYLEGSREVDTEHPLKYWKVQSSVENGQRYNIYAMDDFSFGSVSSINVGFDAGNFSVEEVNYVDNSNPGQTVIIRTNGGALTVDAEYGTVKHYSNLESVKIEKIASASYHEYGTVSYAEIKKGRLVAEEAGVVETVLVTGEQVEIKKEEGGEVNLTYAASAEIAAAIAETSAVEATVVEEGQEVENFVARTSTAGYETLAEAVEAATAGDKIVVLKDLTIGDVIIDKTLSIDGKGHKVVGGGFNAQTGDEMKGYSGFNIEGKGAEIEVVLENMEISKIGNYAVVNVERDDANNGVKAVLRNLGLSEFYCYGLRLSRGQYEIDGCSIDCRILSNKSLSNGISIRGDNKTSNTNQKVIAKIKNCNIYGAVKSTGKWASSAIVAFGPVDLDIDNLKVENCTYGVGLNVCNALTAGEQKLKLTNSSIEADQPVFFDDSYTSSTTKYFGMTYDITIGGGNKLVSTGGDDCYPVEGWTNYQSSLTLSADTATSTYSHDWGVVVFNLAEGAEDYAFDDVHSVYTGE